VAKIGYARAIFLSGRKVWTDALLEIFVVASVSLIPLLGAAIREVLPENSQIYMSDAFAKAFFGGQLLFYALGLIATIVWQSNKDLHSFFPLRIWFNFFSIVAVVICSIVIGFDPTLASVDKLFLARFSMGLFFVSAFLYTLMAVISQVHVNVGKDLASSDAELGDAVKRSRGLS
jgi:hypothetical protein